MLKVIVASKHHGAVRMMSTFICKLLITSQVGWMFEWSPMVVRFNRNTNLRPLHRIWNCLTSWKLQTKQVFISSDRWIKSESCFTWLAFANHTSCRFKLSKSELTFRRSNVLALDWLLFNFIDLCLDRQMQPLVPDGQVELKC